MFRAVKVFFFQTTKVKNRQDKKKKLAGKKSSIPVNKNEGRIRINPPNSHNKISRVQECEHIYSNASNEYKEPYDSQELSNTFSCNTDVRSINDSTNTYLEKSRFRFD